MVNRRAVILSMVLLGCGDGGAGATGPLPGSAGAAGASTGPRPDVTTTAGSDAPGNTTGHAGSSSSLGPDPDDSGSSGVPATDLPPMIDDCQRLDALVAELPMAVDAAARVDQFIAEVTYGEDGFPIVCDGALAVVARQAPGQALSVAGDFNGWVPGEHPLAEPVPGLGFYYARVALPSAPTGLYKIVRGEAEFEADPLARRFGWDRFGEYSQIDPRPDRSHHERWPGLAPAAGTLAPRTVTVYRPPMALVDGPLPVLYMHDGQNLFAPDAIFGGWRVGETLDAAIDDGTLTPMVVVAIDNTADRFDEYTPVPDVIGGQPVGGRADVYADFVVDEIKPFIEERYPVADEPDQLGVMGSSLGGLVSLYIGQRHPEVFGHVGSMSGTIAWGTFESNNPTIVDLYLEQAPAGTRIYLDSGGGEGPGCPEGGSDNYCGTIELAVALRGLGWVDEDDLFYRWQPGAPHNELAWADRLLPALVDWFAVAP